MWIWQRGGFNVPSDIPEIRVLEESPKYVNRFGQAMEDMGYEVRKITLPVKLPFKPWHTLGRNYYRMFALVQKKVDGQTVIEIPDEQVEAVLKKVKGVGLPRRKLY